MLIRFSRCDDVVRRVATCPEGNTAVEFALTVPLLVLLAFGAFDYGSAYVEGVRLNGAARAGTQQALYNSQDWQSTSQMEQAALEEYVGHTLTSQEIAAMSVSATAQAFCACTAGVTLTCTGTCRGRHSRPVRASEHEPLSAPHAALPMGGQRHSGGRRRGGCPRALSQRASPPER